MMWMTAKVARMTGIKTKKNLNGICFIIFVKKGQKKSFLSEA